MREYRRQGMLCLLFFSYNPALALPPGLQDHILLESWWWMRLMCCPDRCIGRIGDDRQDQKSLCLLSIQGSCQSLAHHSSLIITRDRVEDTVYKPFWLNLLATWPVHWDSFIDRSFIHPSIVNPWSIIHSFHPQAVRQQEHRSMSVHHKPLSINWNQTVRSSRPKAHRLSVQRGVIGIP